MKIVQLQLTGTSPYSQSRPHRDEKHSRELPEAYEQRTWRSRLHVDDDGYIVLPGIALKICLAEAAKYASKQIPGRGKSTFTKHFESGILIRESPRILDTQGNPLHQDQCGEGEKPFVYGDWIFTPSDGVPGGGKRVYKCYPVVRTGWSAQIEVVIADDIITESVLVEHLQVAGTLIGLGRWRVRNRGMYGTFNTNLVNFEDLGGLVA
ncbi:MAG: hypothetical protein AAFX78_05005 [Cyanobacteria bacterium J06638_20]